MVEHSFILHVEHVTKKFGDKMVLNDISLDIHPGEFVTILGPSGCGKTTLLRMIAGFETPSEGKILLRDTDITNLAPNHRPMNTVFQHYALFPHLNVYENVAFGLKLKGLSDNEIDRQVIDALHLVGMDDYEEYDIDQLSGGMKQRVAIARAVVNKPEVLLLDEPLSALDYKLRKQMQLELIRMHKELGITFIFVTHDQEEALTMSDTVVVLNEGVIQQMGSPRHIYDEPANRFVANFIGESNIIDGKTVIRPEDITLVKVEDAERLKPVGEVEFARGQVISCVFKGIHYEMYVKTEAGYDLQVQQYDAHPVGTQVIAFIDPEDLSTIEAE